jgi:3-dehydroquinate synthase
MTSLEIRAASGRSTIRIGDASEELIRHLAGRDVTAVTDTNVHRLHGGFFSGMRTIVIEPGESYKTLSTIEKLYGSFLDAGVDRSSFILGVGGGIVCDIAGFAASTYLRGLPFGFVATTLLAQVDAAIGGKNGVNYLGYKNIVGVIRQPEFILADPKFLKTLPAEEIRCGLAEIIKSALIAKAEFFEFLEAHWDKILALEEEPVLKAVTEAAAVKAAVVQADETEQNERRKLNFGHTLGHAFEKLLGLRHGEAVSAGMVLAAKISEARGMLAHADILRIKSLLEKAGLPVKAKAKAGEVVETIRKDKKRQRDDLHFVALSGIGRAEVIRIPYHELEEHIHDLS